MRKIDFRPGYHEWQVIVDDKVIYAFGDFSDRFEEEDVTEDTVYDLVEDLVDAWKTEEHENGNCIPLTEHEINYLRDMMYNVIRNYYL